jgi:hypothetical protein
VRRTASSAALAAKALVGGLAVALTLAAGPVVSGADGQAVEPAQTRPRDVTLCELSKAPSSFDNSRIRLTAFVKFAFEDFTVWDPACAPSDSDFALWVTYGGSASSGAIYCCPGEGIPRAEKAPFPLSTDETYRGFRGLLEKERDTMVRATVVGTLLMRREGTTPIDRMTSSYGHFGCCSLLVIERIESFEPHQRKDLDYSTSSGFYAGRDLRCKEAENRQWELKDDNGQDVLDPWSGKHELFIRQQTTAERGERSWAFTDPVRVALEAARKVHGDSVKSLKRLKSPQGVQILEWQHDLKVTTVVVSRPYWLSFYSPSSQVPWVVTAMKTAWCEKL